MQPADAVVAAQVAFGGQIDLAMDSIAPYVAQVKEGKLRALAIGTRKRFGGLPDVPTTAEAGYPALEASVFYTLLVPRGEHVQADVSERLADTAALNLAPDAPPLRRVTHKAGKGDTVASIAARYKVSSEQVAQWNKVGRGAHFKAGQAVVIYTAAAPTRTAKAKARPAKLAAAKPKAGKGRSVMAAANP